MSSKLADAVGLRYTSGSIQRVWRRFVEMWLLVAAGIVMLGGVFVYVLFMIFFPEWVGITGKTAQDAQRAHLGDRPADETSEPDLIARMQRDHREKKDPR